MKNFMAVLCLISLVACSKSEPDLSHVNFGGVFGALAGAVAGGMVGAEFGGGLGQTLFISSGMLTGASVGFEAGSILYHSDQMAYDNNAKKALDYALDGKVSNWLNPETGNSGIFIPINTFLTADGRFCRSYRSTLAIKKAENQVGVVAHQHGTACQKEGGFWQLANNAGN